MSFVDNFDSWNRPGYFVEDRIHLGENGSWLLSSNMGKVLGQLNWCEDNISITCKSVFTISSLVIVRVPHVVSESGDMSNGANRRNVIAIPDTPAPTLPPWSAKAPGSPALRTPASIITHTCLPSSRASAIIGGTWTQSPVYYLTYICLFPLLQW